MQITKNKTEIMKEIMRKTALMDIAFILDITGSMDYYI